MKSTLKKTCLLWLSLLLVFSIVWFIGVTNLVNWEENTIIRTNPSELHEPSLFSLYLIGANPIDSWLNVGLSADFLSVLNWLIVWKDHSAVGPQVVVIGWWQSNNVSADNAWIGWWQSNNVSADNAWIGWWYSNEVVWNGWVVVWGNNNKANQKGVVLWWLDNDYDNVWVVLWWQSNKAWTNSLVLWQKNVNWGDNSFLWNNKNCNPARGECPSAQNGAAMITATNWVLIWTYNAKPWIALVVDWAIKLWNRDNPDEQWEINVDANWCIKFIDMNGWSEHVLGKTSESQCNAKRWCQFGKTKLQDGETISQNGTGPRDVKAYGIPYSTNCNNERIEVTCRDWTLIPVGATNAYPYCFKISSDPRNPKEINP